MAHRVLQQARKRLLAIIVLVTAASGAVSWIIFASTGNLFSEASSLRSRRPAKHHRNDDVERNLRPSAFDELRKSKHYGGSKVCNVRKDPRHKPPSRDFNHIGASKVSTNVKQDWTIVIREFLDTVEPHMFSTNSIRKSYDNDANNLQSLSLLVTISKGNVTYVEHPSARRHSRISSLRYIIDKIMKEKGELMKPCTFIAVINDGLTPPVATLGPARHWKLWNKMIPVPLGNARGPKATWKTPFEGWDRHIRKTITKTSSNYTWESKQNRALFRGALRMQRYKLGSCNEENNNRCEWANRWNEVNRGWLYEKAKRAPSLFDVGFTARHFKYGRPKTQFDDAPPILDSPLSYEDFQKYKYVINVGSNEDWAERLRSLLFMNSAVVMHQAETQEFFTPLLRPWVHYIPIDLCMNYLVENIEWAVDNDSRVRQIVRNQNAFANRYITERSMQQYWEVLLRNFAKRQKEADRNENV